MTTLVVMAKECVPGRVKTRLHPPFTLDQAAQIAAASLSDTLAAASRWRYERRVLCFAGDRPPPESAGWDVVPQEGAGLDDRIAAVLDSCEGPTVLIGMDTPQVRAEHLPPDAWPDGVDAWLGMAADGGFWALALARPDGALVRGVPMSRADTGRCQRRRLDTAGLTVADLPVLCDIDDDASLREVASGLDEGTLPALLASLDAGRSAVGGSR